MFPKPEPRRRARGRERRARGSTERQAKAAARRRDGGCRFPLCSCRHSWFPLEVSHQLHKGMGGNPNGDRSTPAGLVTLCGHRHRTGVVSIHRGTLRIVALTDAGANGPLAFEIDVSVLDHTPRTEWREIAREASPRRLEPVTPKEREILEELARMKGGL